MFENQRISWSELDQRVTACAKALLNAGVSPGDRVAVFSSPHPIAAISAAAVFAIGGVWVGLNPKYKTEELRRILEDSDPVLLIAAFGDNPDEAQSRLDASCAGVKIQKITYSDNAKCPWTSFDDFLAAGAAASDEDLEGALAPDQDDRVAAIVYTSGSTGAPKGAMLSEQRMVRFGKTQNAMWPVSETRTLNYFPINHVGSLVDVTIPTLVTGGTMVILEQFDPQSALKLMAAERITIWGSVPAGFLLQLAEPNIGDVDLSSVELAVWEGAPLAEDAIKALLSITPKLATNYSMTEMTGAVTIVTPTDDVEVLASSVGRPLPGVDVRLVGEDGVQAETGAPGEVWARSPYAMLGYWRQPDATAETIMPDGFIKTGDVGEWRRDGRLKLVGRNKEMYKTGGYNVYPREVETLLESHPAIAGAYIVSVPDPVWDEVGFAFILPQADVNESDVRMFVKDKAANYKAPKYYSITTELPLLPIGKVDKTALKKQALALSGQTT